VITAFKGIRVLFPGSAAVAAFPVLGVCRIALIHPPWFANDETQLGIAYFRNQGFDVVYVSQMNLRGLPVAKPTDPLCKFTEVYPAELYAFSRAQVPAATEFFWWKRLPRDWRHCGAGARSRCASAHRQPGGILRQAGVREAVNGYGRVFSMLSPEGR
jgi:hypothetical protein